MVAWRPKADISLVAGLECGEGLPLTHSGRSFVAQTTLRELRSPKSPAKWSSSSVKTSKKELVEIVGIFAVVASLIFVGMQLQLDRKIALAEQYTDRAESVKADRRIILESDALMQYFEELWALGWRPGYWDEDWEIAGQLEEGAFSVRSVLAAIVENQLSIIGYDTVYYQYSQGLLDEDVWSGLRGNLKRGMARDELTRAVYAHHARKTIQPVVEELLREIDSEREATESGE